MIEEIAKVFQNNIDNRLTIELANGMIQMIKSIIEKQEKKAAETEVPKAVSK